MSGDEVEVREDIAKAGATGRVGIARLVATDQEGRFSREKDQTSFLRPTV